jgi:hypothetical protein
MTRRSEAPRVEPDLADIAGARKVFAPKLDLLRVILNELRMESERGADVFCGRRQFMIARPCARCCRDRERENLSPLALGDHARMVRVEIEMTVEIDEAVVHAVTQLGPVRTPDSKEPTSSRPRL